jgi:hypothetical protein
MPTTAEIVAGARTSMPTWEAKLPSYAASRRSKRGRGGSAPDRRKRIFPER